MKRLMCIIMAVIMLAAVAGCGMQGSGSNQRPVRGIVPEETPEAPAETPVSPDNMAAATLVIGVTCGSETIKDTMTANGAIGEAFTFEAEDIESRVCKISLPNGYILTNSEARQITVPYGEKKSMYFIAEYVELPDLTHTPAPTSSDSGSGAALAEITTGQKNALSRAKSYISVMPFSRDGLFDQLKYEGYTDTEAAYGADNCGADWMQQAEKKAMKYLSVMPFSRTGLIDQLEYDGFTSDQAEHGVDSCNADWMEQAVKKAKDYLDVMPFSRSGLIDQLMYSGFTREQAEYGATQNGLN